MKENKISFKVYGKQALFSDPITRVGGEKSSYLVPTYEALRGIVSGIYWKPSILWYIDRVRVVNKIKTEAKATKPMNYSGGANQLAIYTYLTDVEYQVEAHFEINKERKDIAEVSGDQMSLENKHYFIATRMLEKGGKRDVFMGTRECVAYVQPCVFGEGDGFYDNYGEIDFGLMFHGFTYPEESGDGKLYARFDKIKLKDGVIEFKSPKEEMPTREIKTYKVKDIKTNAVADEETLKELGYYDVSK